MKKYKRLLFIFLVGCVMCRFLLINITVLNQHAQLSVSKSLENQNNVKKNSENHNTVSIESKDASSHEFDYFKHLIINYNVHAPGANGNGVQLNQNSLSNEHKQKLDEGWRLHGFNQFVSDLIPLQRSVPPVPDIECKQLTYAEHLPDTSIIIIFYNEAFSTVLRTVYSVLNTTTDRLVKEIILVDDCSDMEHLKEPLEIFMKLYFPEKVKLYRTGKRIGLTQARIFGVKFATAETLTFLDAHCECAEQWLEPLLDQIAKKHTTVAAPVFDIIKADTFEYLIYSGKFAPIGAFNWLLDFVWISRPLYQWSKRQTPISPTMSPVMLGGIFTIHKKWFRKLGYYDHDLQLYGSEHLELSFKIWMCGGSLVQLACSHVGHVFRTSTPYLKPIEPVLRRNKLRVAAVWMDGYKHFFDKTIRFDPMEYGNITERKELRNSLQCHDFKWYLENILPQRDYSLHYDAFGTVKTVSNNVCLHANFAESTDEGKTVKLNGKECSVRDEHQAFILETYSKRFKIETSCLVYDNKSDTVFLALCESSDTREQWKYEELMLIRHLPSQKCLKFDKTFDSVLLAACDNNAQQMWDWSRNELNLQT